MTEEEIRELIRQGLIDFDRSDRFTIQKLIQIFDGRNIQLATGTGTKIGTATGQKIGIWNTTPIIQPSSTGETSGFTVGSGTGANDDSTFTGNSGSKAYTTGDIVKHLKAFGILET